MELKRKIQLASTRRAKEREKEQKNVDKANEGESEEWKKVIVLCQQGKDIELYTHTRVC